MVLVGISFAAEAQQPLAQPAAVKAAFLYRFTHYVQWPQPLEPGQPFTIAVLGGDEVAEALIPVLAERRVHDSPAVVRTLSSIKEVDDARVLYVGPAYVGSLVDIATRLRGRPILLVTDRDGALGDGGMINFVMVERRVRFEISLTPVRQSGLNVGAGLLSVAVNVRGGPRSDLECWRRNRSYAPGHCPMELAAR